jgi:hypothetical protein
MSTEKSSASPAASERKKAWIRAYGKVWRGLEDEPREKRNRLAREAAAEAVGLRRVPLSKERQRVQAWLGPDEVAFLDAMGPTRSEAIRALLAREVQASKK